MGASLLELAQNANLLIYALLLCSAVALAATLERLYALRHSRIVRLSVLQSIETAIKDKDLQEALSACQENPCPMMRITKVALINFQNSKEEIKNAIEDAGKLEIPFMQRFMTLLNTIAVITPLLGLLGTVMGMITVFDSMLSDGTANLGNLSEGISDALVTTALGLTVAVPTLIVYNFFSRRIETLVNEMERHSLTVFNLILRSKENRF